MLSRIAFTMGLVLALGGTTHAGTLFAGPFMIREGEDVMCRATNISSQPRSVLVEILDEDGVVVANRGDEALEPMHSTFSAAPSSLEPVLCRVQVAGSRRAVRVSAIVFMRGAGEEPAQIRAMSQGY